MINGLRLIEGFPAAHIPKESMLVVGDMHIGLELKLHSYGIHFYDASSKDAEIINKLGKSVKAKSLVILGDVKESIGNPGTNERNLLFRFFSKLDFNEVMIAKGNHDAGLKELLHANNYKIPVEKEIAVGKFVFMHGHITPSINAMQHENLVVAHAHYAHDVYGKVWVYAKKGKGLDELYKKHAKNPNLLVVPAFSNMIIGSSRTNLWQNFLPVFRKSIFEFSSAKFYNLNDGRIARKKIEFEPTYVSAD